MTFMAPDSEEQRRVRVWPLRQRVNDLRARGLGLDSSLGSGFLVRVTT